MLRTFLWGLFGYLLAFPNYLKGGFTDDLYDFPAIAIFLSLSFRFIFFIVSFSFLNVYLRYAVSIILWWLFLMYIC